MNEIKYDYKVHWNNAYQKNPIEKLGWFEENPIPSLDLIEKCCLSKEALIFHAGAGATKLIDLLLTKGYNNIVVNDISNSSLKKLKNSLKKNSSVKYIVDDLTNPSKLLNLKSVDLWHDRAILHFFTEEKQRKIYFNLLKKIVKPGGYVILSEFNLDGAKKCCDLDIFNYNQDMLQKRLGNSFLLLKAFDYLYKHPSNGNTRKYIYTLFQRKI